LAKMYCSGNAVMKQIKTGGSAAEVPPRGQRHAYL
jgi:hypothetical protein